MKLGLVLPQSGPAGIWAPSALACANMAIHEINASGGLLGAPMELHLIDNFVDERRSTQVAREAVKGLGLDAVIGMCPSYSRETLANAIGSRVPFLYTPPFEGSADHEHLVAIGDTTQELLEPAIDWLIDKRRARRFYLCGSRYNWAESSFGIIKTLLTKRHVELVGEHYLALESDDHSALIDDIERRQPDVVLPFFLGSDAIRFNRAFGRAGLSSRVVRCTPGLDETILYGLNADDTENLYSVAGYFSALPSANNRAFLERYHTLYGEHPPPTNTYGQSCYEGIYSLYSLAAKSRTLRREAVLREVGRTPLLRTTRGSQPMPLVGARGDVYLAGFDGFEISIINQFSRKPSARPRR